jgi:hypothetical protein
VLSLQAGLLEEGLQVLRHNLVQNGFLGLARTVGRWARPASWTDDTRVQRR